MELLELANLEVAILYEDASGEAGLLLKFLEEAPPLDEEEVDQVVVDSEVLEGLHGIHPLDRLVREDPEPEEVAL